MNRKPKFRTNILFQRASFFKGMGSILNVSGNYYRFDYSESDLIADAKAIKSDWGVTGEDINFAIQHYLQKAKR